MGRYNFKTRILKIHKWQRILWRSPINFKFEIKKIHLGKKEGECGETFLQFCIIQGKQSGPGQLV